MSVEHIGRHAGASLTMALKDFWSSHGDAVTSSVITAAVIGSASMFWVMHGTMSTMTANIAAISDRLDRIATSLPDIGIRIASESLLQNYGVAVVSLSDDGQKEKIILDLERRVGQRFLAPVALQDQDLSIAAMVTGVVKMSSTSAFMFSELNKASVLAGKETASPVFVDADLSWVSTGKADGLKANLSAMGFTAGEPFALSGDGTSNYAAILEQVRAIN